MIVLRPAEATVQEGEEFARYLDVAAEGFFRLLFGPQATQIIGKAFVHPEHNYSYEHVLFALKDDRIVGMAAGFTAEQHRKFNDDPVNEAAGRHKYRIAILQLLFAPMLRVLDTVNAGDFYVLAIATDPDVRGEGIGSALMDAMEARAVHSQATQLALDVSADNNGARRLYERRGMVVASQWPKRLRIPNVKLYRMTKRLTANAKSDPDTATD